MTTVKHFARPLAAALVLAASAPTSVHGSDAMIQLLNVLKARGSISESEFQALSDTARSETAAPKAAAVPGAPAGPAPGGNPAAMGASDKPAAGSAAATSPEMTTAAADAIKRALKDKWYERISARGYMQLRYSPTLDHEGVDLNVPNDGSVSDTGSFLMRRGRVILSGDATERLFIYAQADLNGSISTGDFSLSMRDYYGDVALDDEKEFRVRLGQSKVPFGWVNLQSSQNRIPVERPDALNNAVEGERDLGAFMYWAPADTRKLFRELIRSGLKGSGDYGVVGVGAYSGQGLNRLDLNGEPHVVARASYPWKLDNGQIVEAGVQAYRGKFVSGVSSLTLNGNTFTPSRGKDGVVDQRAGATFILYPQPFGVEAEWNFGQGPELNPDSQSIESEFLHGGYAQLSYRIQKHVGDWFPFLRWHYFDGGRKFAVNAPGGRVHEIDVGVEWQPWPELELTASYTHTLDRTNTRLAPYANAEDAHRLSFQAQFNF